MAPQECYSPQENDPRNSYNSREKWKQSCIEQSFSLSKISNQALDRLSSMGRLQMERDVGWRGVAQFIANPGHTVEITHPNGEKETGRSMAPFDSDVVSVDYIGQSRGFKRSQIFSVRKSDGSEYTLSIGLSRAAQQQSAPQSVYPEGTFQNWEAAYPEPQESRMKKMVWSPLDWNTERRSGYQKDVWSPAWISHVPNVRESGGDTASQKLKELGTWNVEGRDQVFRVGTGGFVRFGTGPWDVREWFELRFPKTAIRNVQYFGTESGGGEVFQISLSDGKKVTALVMSAMARAMWSQWEAYSGETSADSNGGIGNVRIEWKAQVRIKNQYYP